MAFQPPTSAPDLIKLKSVLLTSGIQNTNNALFQVIDQLIAYLRNIQNLNSAAFAASGSSIVSLADKTYITVNDETSSLPNSRELIAGTGITFDDTIAGERTINADIPAIIEEVFERTLAIKSIEVSLFPGAQNGKVFVDGVFEEEEIGPIVVNQAITNAVELDGIIEFAGEIINKRQMKLVWFAPFGAPSKTRVNYVSGVR